MKKALIVLFAAAILTSCGTQPQQAADTEAEDQQISAIVSDPLALEDQAVRFEGIISHVCRHSGDKMRIVQESDDAYSILVMLGDFATAIDPEMEGQKVMVTGLVKAEVANLDALQEEHVHGEDCDHEEEQAHEEGDDCESTQEAIARLKEKGIDPDIRVVVEMTAFELI